jgi:(2R)-phospho-3-sulfolactate synthase (ComA)
LGLRNAKFHPKAPATSRTGSDLARRHLEAGAELVMIESEGITEQVREWRTDVVARVVAEPSRRSELIRTLPTRRPRW